MKKKELKRNLTEAKAKIDMLETQLAAEKLNSAFQKAAKEAEKCSIEAEKCLLIEEIDDIKRELAQKTIELNWFHEKGSEELWSINDFLNTMAKNLEKIANKRNLEGNSIKIDIIPIPLKDGLIRGYTSIVMTEEY